MKTILLTLVLIVITLFSPVLTIDRYDKNEENYDYEDSEDESYYDREFENSTDYNYSYSYNYEEEAELNYVPELITRPQRIVVRQGEDAELPCEANDSSKFVRIWMKGGTMLFMGEVRSVHAADNVNVEVSSFSQEEVNLQPEENNNRNPSKNEDDLERSSLKINNIQPNDAGEYTCRIMIRSTNEINVTHTIHVQKAGLSVITNPISGFISLTEGDAASLSCELLDEGEDGEEEEIFRSLRSSRSLSIFTWTREGLQFSNSGKYTHLGNELNINNITKSDAGFYFCTTKARNGELMSGQIRIEVSFPPKIISLQKSAIKTGQGLVAEIACAVTGEPKPKVTWYKGDEAIEAKKDGRIIYAKSGVRHTLTINRVRTDDSGRYICYAVNDLGSSQTSIDLSTETQDLLDYDIEMTSILETNKNDENRMFDFSSSNKSPTVRLIKEIYEDLLLRSNENKEAINDIKDTIHNEISSVRNITYQMLGENGGLLSNVNTQYASQDLDGLENQLFIDLRTIKVQLTEIENQYGKDISSLLKFQQTMKHDVPKLWDNLYDMQEVENITSRNIEEMYDKDILVLHNFRTETTNQIAKLQNDLESIINSAEQGQYASISALSDQFSSGLEQSIDNSSPVNALSSIFENKFNLVQEELKNLNDVLVKQQQNDNVFRSQLQDVFEDVDSLKGKQRSMNQGQEKTNREIQRLKSEEIIDLTHRLDVNEDSIEDIRRLQIKSNSKKNVAKTMDDEKLLLVINEMTKLKNQIYYLQQSILILKNTGKINFAVGNKDETNSNGNSGDHASPTTILDSRSTTTNSFMTTELFDNPLANPQMDSMITQLTQQIRECTREEKFAEFSKEMQEKMNECSGEIENMKSRWTTDTSRADNQIKRNVTILNKRLSGVSKRLERTENEAKKYNLIISGIPKTRKLERTTHLERIMKDFFQNVLGLSKVQFDEVQRIQPDTPAKGDEHDEDSNRKGANPVLIKFPSVRTKLTILKSSRSMSAESRRVYSIGEDFTETVKQHRRRLVAFARKRSRITKKKWALKYNELYMNGKLFVFDEEKNRVVPFKN